MSRLDQVQTDTLFKRKLIVTSIAAALGMTGAPLAIGQETSLEEIIVTARQRAESSQEVPMMIQSLSGEDVQKQGITTLEDFSRFVGSLNVQTTTAGQNTIVFQSSNKETKFHVFMTSKYTIFVIVNLGLFWFRCLFLV